MRAAGQFNAQLIDYVRDFIKPGITTLEIDKLVHDYTLKNGHVPATLGYMGYTRSCCTSINDVVCHGIPDNTVLKEGDIVNVDVTSIVAGWHGDHPRHSWLAKCPMKPARSHNVPSIVCTWP